MSIEMTEVDPKAYAWIEYEFQAYIRDYAVGRDGQKVKHDDPVIYETWKILGLTRRDMKKYDPGMRFLEKSDDLAIFRPNLAVKNFTRLFQDVIKAHDYPEGDIECLDTLTEMADYDRDKGFGHGWFIRKHLAEIYGVGYEDSKPQPQNEPAQSVLYNPPSRY